MDAFSTPTISLNLVWPAIYVFSEFWQFWYLVIATILIETVTIWLYLKFNLQKSFYVSLIANLTSGILGTFILMWAMLFWHGLIDKLLPDATFDRTNWIATYILMFLGSVLLEVLTIRIIFKQPVKSLLIPLLAGNLLTYSVIVYSIETKTDKDPKERRRESIIYRPIPARFTLLDGSHLFIKDATVTISYGEEDIILNKGYSLVIPFEKEYPRSFQFELRYIDSKYAGGISDSLKIIRLEHLFDTLFVVLEQKNPAPDIGWTEPIITDTIRFITFKLPASLIWPKKQWFTTDSSTVGD